MWSSIVIALYARTQVYTRGRCGGRPLWQCASMFLLAASPSRQPPPLSFEADTARNGKHSLFWCLRLISEMEAYGYFTSNILKSYAIIMKNSH